MRDKRLESGALFPTDTPLVPGDLIGRAQDVDRIASSLTAGVNLVVAGPRRTGKTSACDAALQICADEGLYVAAVDLFYMADAAQLTRDLSLSVLANRSVLRRAIQGARALPEKLEETLTVTASLRARQDLGEDIDITWKPRLSRADPLTALRTAFELPERIAVADDRRVAVFIDEFQEIGSGIFGDPGVLTRLLRAVLQRSPRVSVLFAGSMEHLMRDIFAPEDRALSQFGSFYELQPITEEEWSEGVRERLARDETTITATALDRLLGAGEAHPRTTMLIARESHVQAVEDFTHELEDAHVQQGIDRAVRADRLRHEQLLARIRSIGRFGQQVAQRIAIGAKLYDGIAPQSAKRTIDQLHDLGIIERGARRGEWSVTDPLLRRFLRELPLAGPVIIEKSVRGSTRAPSP